MLNTQSKKAKQLCLIVGSSSKLVSFITTQYSNLGFDVITTSSKTSNINSIHLDLASATHDYTVLDCILDKYTNVDIWWLAAVKSNNLEESININILSPIKFYDFISNKNNLNWRMIVVGSQGDLHAGTQFPYYNMSKAALANYFIGIGLWSCKGKIFLIRPWLFKSNMYSKDYLVIDPSKLVNQIIRNINNSKIIVNYPSSIYFMLSLLKLFSEKLLHIIVKKFND